MQVKSSLWLLAANIRKIKQNYITQYYFIASRTTTESLIQNI